MEEKQRQKLETLVKHHAALEARGYYLKNPDHGRYPNNGCYLIDPFEVPDTLPSGAYQVFFTRSLSTDAPALPANGPNPIISLTQPAAENSSKNPPKESNQLAPKPDPKNAWLDDPLYAKNRLELEAERFAHEMQENHLLIGKQVRLAAENAEYIVMMRAMRHELEAAYQMQSETQRANLQLQANLMALLAEERKRTAPSGQQEQQGSSWLTPDVLRVGAMLLKGLLAKDGDAMDSKIAERQLSELKRKRDEAKAKLRAIEAGKKANEPKVKQQSANKPKKTTKIKGRIPKAAKQ